jgi:hypothetical protein
MIFSQMQSTLTANINQSQFESKVVCGQSELQSYIKAQEEQARKERLLAVRQQESKHTKESVA